MEPAPPVKWGFFPLDEELALLPGSLTPRQQDHLVHLASCLPFEQAAKMMERLLGVQVSEATVRRQTEQAGACAYAVQTAQALTEAPVEPGPPSAVRLALSADGAYVPLLKGVWAEVRTVVIGEVKAEKKRDRTAEVHVQQISSFSRMTDATTFADLAEGEIRRRGVRQAEEVCAVTDGADWLQSFLDLHRPDVQRILDFPHAAEHVSALIQGVRASGIDLPDDLLERSLHRLKQRGPALLMRLLARLPGHLAEREGVRDRSATCASEKP